MSKEWMSTLLLLASYIYTQPNLKTTSLIGLSHEKDSVGHMYTKCREELQFFSGFQKIRYCIAQEHMSCQHSGKSGERPLLTAKAEK